MTNAEKIRSMSDEELAKFLSDLPFAFDEHLWTYPSVKRKWYRDQDKAIKDNLDWLKSEVGRMSENVNAQEFQLKWTEDEIADAILKADDMLVQAINDKSKKCIKDVMQMFLPFS